jgi:hypothetical protein
LLGRGSGHLLPEEKTEARDPRTGKLGLGWEQTSLMQDEIDR